MSRVGGKIRVWAGYSNTTFFLALPENSLHGVYDAHVCDAHRHGDPPKYSLDNTHPSYFSPWRNAYVILG